MPRAKALQNPLRPKTKTMAEIINLNRFRKQAAKQQDKAKAEANRLAYGRSKAEKLKTDKERAQIISHVDGHKLTPDE